jgi:general secretion pathway protein C
VKVAIQTVICELCISCLNDNAPMTKLWTVKITIFLLWALAAGSATFWVLQAMGSTNREGAPSKQIATSNAPPEPSKTPQIALALGAKNPVAPSAAGAIAAAQARLQLQGVVSNGSSGGAALISVDGKPAKPYLVGATIDDGLEVTSIKAREASIGTNGVTAFTLELPLKK